MQSLIYVDKIRYQVLHVWSDMVTMYEVIPDLGPGHSRSLVTTAASLSQSHNNTRLAYIAIILNYFNFIRPQNTSVELVTTNVTCPWLTEDLVKPVDTRSVLQQV